MHRDQRSFLSGASVMTAMVLVTATALCLVFATKTRAVETKTISLSTAGGANWEFQPENGVWKSIVVPGGGWRAQGYTCDAGTYKTAISIPTSAQGHDIRLKFEAINFGADILVGSSEASLTEVGSHVDGWLPVSVDITKFVTPGRSTLLEVEVKGRRKFMLHGKYLVPEGATWDPYLEEGILRGVSLEILPLVHVDSVFAVTKLGPDTVAAEVSVTNSSPIAQKVVLTSRVLTAYDGKPTKIQWPSYAVNLNADETRVIQLPTIPWLLGRDSYWWPNVPYRANYHAHLYTVAVDVNSNRFGSHHYEQRFGFRQFAAVGNHYYLNGVRCNLRGDNLQEANFGTDAYGIRPGFGAPSPGNGGWPEAVDNLQRLNFNVMRIHQIPATPYMLDVCDEKGLMLVDESPLRGSEGGEDYQDGKDNMLNMDKELVARDRNHPSVILWSAANEWSDPIADAVPAILAIDPTRPVIADGAGAAAPAIDTRHYVSGFNVLPRKGADIRQDRPYGETEDIWPGDNTLQGFAWMGTGIRLRRLLGDADLRNYTLNNAWPNFVPGESPANEILERKVKGDANETILPSIVDPWHNPHIQLLQNCYNPVAVADVDFDAANANSDLNGDWPVKTPVVAMGTRVTRTIAVFNDEFSETDVELKWQARLGSVAGAIIGSGSSIYSIPLGDFRKVDIAFPTPANAGQKICLLLSSSKQGQARCRETQISYVTGDPNAALLKPGDYGIKNETSGLYLGISSDGGSIVQQSASDAHQVWTVSIRGSNVIVLKNKATGSAIETAEGQTSNGSSIVVGPPSGKSSQDWELQASGDGYTLLNPDAGRVMDDYHQSKDEGAPVVLYDANGGLNQVWDFVAVRK